MEYLKEQTINIQEGKFSAALYRQHTEYQQGLNNENNDKLSTIIERTFPNAKIQPLAICDLGCGYGNATIELFNKLKSRGILIKEIVGYDFSSSQISEANRLKEKTSIPQVSFFLQDIQLLQDKERYDVIFSWFTLHWLNDIKKACGIIYHALKPGGIIVYLNPLEKASLFNLRENLIKSPKWSETFSGYTLKPFISYNSSYEVNKLGYENVFSEHFEMEPAFSYRDTVISLFQTERDFIHFLKSWMQELRIERNGKAIFNEEKKVEYVVDLVNSIKNLKYDATREVNYLPDGRIEFHDPLVFYCWHKSLTADLSEENTTREARFI